MTAGVIIFFMQSGFALLESGNVRFKNYQNILLKNCMDACIGAMVWWICGFAFAFGLQNDNKFIGTQYFFASKLGDDDVELGYGFWFF
jgi:Amt family ammonium transporter